MIFVGTCAEGQVWCKETDRCQGKDDPCATNECEYPGFLCRDEKMCLKKEHVCNGKKDCNDGSDEAGCRK